MQSGEMEVRWTLQRNCAEKSKSTGYGLGGIINSNRTWNYSSRKENKVIEMLMEKTILLEKKPIKADAALILEQRSWWIRKCYPARKTTMNFSPLSGNSCRSCYCWSSGRCASRFIKSGTFRYIKNICRLHSWK